MFTELEKKIISLIQGDIPITSRPYLEMAKYLDIKEKKFIDILKSLSDRNIIRRFGATLRHQKSGFKANVMVAWWVNEKKTDEVGKIMASFEEVSHCYRRNPKNEWPFNIYTMIHGKDKKNCINIAKKISEKTSVCTYKLLFSEKELKKTSMKYFKM